MFDVIINDGVKKFPSDNIYYVIAKNGVFIKKTMGILDALVPVNEISHLESVTPFVKMNMPKISSEMFGQVCAFFKQVYDEYRSEAIILIFMHRETGEYLIHVPFQKVSGASAKYTRGITITDYISVGTIHSHADFGAFHSGTDENDEAGFDGFHATVGNVNSVHPSIVASVVSNGFRCKVDPAQYIDGITEHIEAEEISEPGYYYLYGVKIKKNPSDKRGYKTSNKYFSIPEGTIPDQWMKQVDGQKYIPRPIYNYNDMIYDGGRMVRRENSIPKRSQSSIYGDDWWMMEDYSKSFLDDVDYESLYPHQKISEKDPITPCDKCAFKEYKGK